MSHQLQMPAKLANLSLLEAISQELPKLNKTQTKVAKAILDDPQSATESSIANLAKRSAVSEPSVNRFCKRFNAKGFPDLKLKIARSLASGISYTYRRIDASDTVDSFTPKIFDAAISNLAIVRENICYQRIDQIVEKLIQARHIYFYALGASAIVARDAVNKFLRLNLPVSSHDDIMIQQVFAARGNYGDVFFIISDAEQSKEILEIAQTAKKNGSTVISLTPSNTPLADISSLSLFVDIFEFSKQPAPLSFRIEQLVILDVLSTGVALYNSKTIGLSYQN
jgi:RpiR family carbohydrate utilization transcriptional regulator